MSIMVPVPHAWVAIHQLHKSNVKFKEIKPLPNYAGHKLPSCAASLRSNSQSALYSVQLAQIYRHYPPELPCMLAPKQAIVCVISGSEVDMLLF